MTALRFRLTIPLDYPKIGVDGWRTRALCAQRVKGGTAEAWWWDDKVGVDDVREDPPSRRRRMARARAVCAQCPAVQSCLANVEPANDTGMRGGVDLRPVGQREAGRCAGRDCRGAGCGQGQAGGCGVTPAETALRDAWIAEMWPVCREVSREERAVEKARHGLGRNALTCNYEGTTKAGRAGASTPELPALTPEQARAAI